MIQLTQRQKKRLYKKIFFKAKPKFDSITGEWMREMLDLLDMAHKDLSIAMNVSPSQVSQWLSGNRIPTEATKAGIYYFFKSELLS
jgi:transcriptional regulator with XRE-family HTH domain